MLARRAGHGMAWLLFMPFSSRTGPPFLYWLRIRCCLFLPCSSSSAGAPLSVFTAVEKLKRKYGDFAPLKQRQTELIDYRSRALQRVFRLYHEDANGGDADDAHSMTHFDGDELMDVDDEDDEKEESAETRAIRLQNLAEGEAEVRRLQQQRQPQLDDNDNSALAANLLEFRLSVPSVPESTRRGGDSLPATIAAHVDPTRFDSEQLGQRERAILDVRNKIADFLEHKHNQNIQLVSQDKGARHATTHESQAPPLTSFLSSPPLSPPVCLRHDGSTCRPAPASSTTAPALR